MAQKYKLPNYELILLNWSEVQRCCFETDTATEQKVCSIMEELLDKAFNEKKNIKNMRFSVHFTTFLIVCMDQAAFNQDIDPFP